MAKMTKAEVEDLAVRLLVIVKRNESNWHQYFTDSEVRDLRKMWNYGLAEGDTDYWSDHRD